MLFQVSCLHDMAVPDKSILAEALSTQKQMYMDVEREKKNFPQDTEILDWGPTGLVLCPGEKMSFKPWLTILPVMLSQ